MMVFKTILSDHAENDNIALYIDRASTEFKSKRFNLLATSPYKILLLADSMGFEPMLFYLSILSINKEHILLLLVQ